MKFDDVNRADLKIPVRDLKVGMYVCGLDREWLGTPFELQGLFVRSQADIEEARRVLQPRLYIGDWKAEVEWLRRL